jgi:adenosine deaminase
VGLRHVALGDGDEAREPRLGGEEIVVGGVEAAGTVGVTIFFTLSGFLITSLLVEELADRGTVLEVCPGSNVALGVYPSFEEHPLPALRAAGVRVTLGSDDPPYFATSIGREYEIARERMGFGDDELLEMTRNAVDAAFADEPLRAKLRARL